MRTIVTTSGLLVIVAICIAIHCCIINQNMRDREVSNSLDKATDYAMDIVNDIYSKSDFRINDTKYTSTVMSAYCNAVNEKVETDGNLTVKLVKSDISKGLFEVLVTEEYSYKIPGIKRGVTSCDKTFVLY